MPWRRPEGTHGQPGTSVVWLGVRRRCSRSALELAVTGRVCRCCAGGSTGDASGCGRLRREPRRSGCVLAARGGGRQPGAGCCRLRREPRCSGCVLAARAHIPVRPRYRGTSMCRCQDTSAASRLRGALEDVASLRTGLAIACRGCRSRACPRPRGVRSPASCAPTPVGRAGRCTQLRSTDRTEGRIRGGVCCVGASAGSAGVHVRFAYLATPATTTTPATSKPAASSPRQ